MFIPVLSGNRRLYKTIGDGVVEESRHPEEPLGDEIYPLHEHLESQVVTEVYRGKVGSGEDRALIQNTPGAPRLSPRL